jgi:maleylacetoacetate isomerase
MKGLKYDINPVHLVKAENKSNEFEKINPFKKIPLLQFNSEIGELIYMPESMAICEFLEEAFPDVKLLPTDLIGKSKVRAICTEISCNIQPLQNLPVLNKIQEIGYDKLIWAKDWIEKGLSDVEKMITSTRGKFCYGDNVTLADAFLIPQLYNARRFGVNLNNFTNIIEIENNLNNLEAFINAKPENQIDFEPDK